MALGLAVLVGEHEPHGQVVAQLQFELGRRDGVADAPVVAELAGRVHRQAPERLDGRHDDALLGPLRLRQDLLQDLHRVVHLQFQAVQQALGHVRRHVRRTLTARPVRHPKRRKKKV